MEGVQDVQRFRDRVEIKFDGDSEYRPFKFGSTIQDFVRSFGYALDPTSDLNAMVAGAYNIGNPVLNQDYETGVDFIGLDPTNYLDQLELARRTAEYEKRKANRQSQQPRGGGQQGGGTGELDN
jgi:hypothetical protein